MFPLHGLAEGVRPVHPQRGIKEASICPLETVWSRLSARESGVVLSSNALLGRALGIP